MFLLAVAGPSPFPPGLPGRLAAGGMAGLAAWSAVSAWWAPLVGAAFDNVQRILLYLGVLLAALALLRRPTREPRSRAGARAGALLVIGYGLAGRLLPGIVELGRSWGAGGRLEQPLTYWNATGGLAPWDGARRGARRDARARAVAARHRRGRWARARASRCT